jgi:hypothetical protein
MDDSVFERELAVRMRVAQCTRSRALKMNRRWRGLKKHQLTSASIPEVITVPSPQVGDIPSCELRMLSASMKSKGPPSVLLELTSESLTWLANAIDWQFKKGTFSSSYVSRRKKKRNHESDATASDDGSGDEKASSKPEDQELAEGSRGAEDELGEAPVQDAAEAKQEGGVIPASSARGAVDGASAGDPKPPPPASMPVAESACPPATRKPNQPPANKQLKLSEMFDR